MIFVNCNAAEWGLCERGRVEEAQTVSGSGSTLEMHTLPVLYVLFLKKD